MPDDLDDRFYLAAPADQQPPAHLKGGETVELMNLTPAGYLRFQLPRVFLGFETYFYSKEVVRHRPTLHTVILEPDVPQVTMVWNTVLQCHAKALEARENSGHCEGAAAILVSERAGGRAGIAFEMSPPAANRG